MCFFMGYLIIYFFLITLPHSFFIAICMDMKRHINMSMLHSRIKIHIDTNNELLLFLFVWWSLKIVLWKNSSFQ
jgi:hypothetical protein